MLAPLHCFKLPLPAGLCRQPAHPQPQAQRHAGARGRLWRARPPAHHGTGGGASHRDCAAGRPGQRTHQVGCRGVGGWGGGGFWSWWRQHGRAVGSQWAPLPSPHRHLPALPCPTIHAPPPKHTCSVMQRGHGGGGPPPPPLCELRARPPLRQLHQQRRRLRGPRQLAGGAGQPAGRCALAWVLGLGSFDGGGWRREGASFMHGGVCLAWQLALAPRHCTVRGAIHPPIHHICRAHALVQARWGAAGTASMPLKWAAPAQVRDAPLVLGSNGARCPLLSTTCKNCSATTAFDSQAH